MHRLHRNMMYQHCSKSFQGFTYIGLLIIITIAGIGLSEVGVLWQTEMQREREKELLFVGNQYKQAINSYYQNSPGSIKQLPTKLDDLLLDSRFPSIKRHLRQMYVDPMTGKASWGLEMQGGEIVGVYSTSLLKPFKKNGFKAGYETFTDAVHYSDWKFTFNADSGLSRIK